MNLSFSCLFVAVICLALCNVIAVDIACHVNADDQCVFDQDVDLTGKQEVKITNSDQLLETTTTIVIQAPLKTNFIPFVIFEKFPNLKSLTIKEVGLSEISSDDFVNAKSLTILNIENNNIGTLKAQSFSTLKNLLELDLSENKITKIEDGAFEGLLELQKLNLYANKIPDLDITKFTKFPKLEYLIVAHMDFPFSAPYESADLAKVVALNSTVTRLDLSNNPITVSDVWRRLSIFPNLETVFFTATNITHIDHMDEFKQLLPHLHTIIMDENPFDSKWLEEAKEYFKKENIKFQDL